MKNSILYFILSAVCYLQLLSSLNAATFHVNNPTELQNALNTAATNNEADSIILHGNTYSISSTITFWSDEDYSIVIYSNENTSLNGNNSVQVMNLITVSGSGDMKIEGIAFENGIADYGGGLYVETSSAGILIENCSFENNTGNIICGGADCYSNSGNIEIKNCTFTGNSSPNTTGYPNGTAGGLFVQTEDPGAQITLTGSFFENNTAQRDAAGAMLYPLGSNSTVNALDNTFQNNTAQEFGGGCWIRCPGGDATVVYQNNVLDGNQTESAGSGGGTYIEIETGSIEMSNNTHTNNTAIWQGGGLWISHNGGTISLTENIFSDNQSVQNGGGANIFLESGTASLSRNQFDGNTSDDVGGGLSISTTSGELTIINNTFYGNSGSEGSDVYSYFDSNSSSCDFRNNILYNSTQPALAYSGQQTVMAEYCDIQNGTGESWFGTGCIDADPLFEDESNSDFHLTWANYPVEDATKSPCIDTGDPASATDPDGTTADMGAYPFENSTLALEFNYFEVRKINNCTVLLKWAVENNKSTDYYIIQKSDNTQNWKEVANIYSNNSGFYRIIDKNPFPGVNYYRLKIFDKDGSFIYSEVKSINISSASEIIIANPVVNYTIVRYNIQNTGNVKIELINQSGKEIKTFVNNYLSAGLYQFELNTQDYNQGIYYIKLSNDCCKVVKKIVLVEGR